MRLSGIPFTLADCIDIGPCRQFIHTDRSAGDEIQPVYIGTQRHIDQMMVLEFHDQGKGDQGYGDGYVAQRS